MWVLYAMILAAPFSENVLFNGKYHVEFETKEQCQQEGRRVVQELVDVLQSQTPVPLRGLYKCEKEGEML